MFKLVIVFSLISLVSCSQNKIIEKQKEVKVETKKVNTSKTSRHSYGGWYCPDNLNGFPSVNIAEWKNVPVVKDRLATKEETQNGTALIFVDSEKYPNAKTIDIGLPRLAKYFSYSSKRDELIIVIQALNIDNDSIVGFRYLNGGNGSAKLEDIRLLSDDDVEQIPSSRFVKFDIEIDVPQDSIWKVITDPKYSKFLEPIFDIENQLKADWRYTSNVNFFYQNSGIVSATYAQKLYGCYYVQNDYLQYNEKMLLLEDEETKMTTLKIVCGPFTDDYETQKAIIMNWAQKVKNLSEKG